MPDGHRVLRRIVAALAVPPFRAQFGTIEWHTYAKDRELPWAALWRLPSMDPQRPDREIE
jgi:hypothetical protein